MSEKIEKIKDFVRFELEGFEGGHDFWHAIRVHNNALYISRFETCNPFIVESASLLHDIADPKFNNGDEQSGINKIEKFLRKESVDSNTIHEISRIIKHMSFRGGHNTKINSIEFKIVQDADRLDAIGAIGIARTFNYGGFKNREIYNPDIPPVEYNNSEEYMNSSAPTINHFYEKLLKLKDLMNTETAKKIAKKRHDFMEKFLEEFFIELYIKP